LHKETHHIHAVAALREIQGEGRVWSPQVPKLQTATLSSRKQFFVGLYIWNLAQPHNYWLFHSFSPFTATAV